MISPTPYVLPSVVSIARRQFLCGPAFQEGQVSLTIASGGVGKTTLCIAEAVAMAGGFSLFQNEPSKLKVWFISAEEDAQEMDRRIAAACEIGHASRPSYLYVDCVTRPDIQIANTEGIDYELVDRLIQKIKEEEIKVVFVDPFICTHAVSENDNVKIDKVARAWRDIAIKGRCAVHIIHHQAKVLRGNSDGARGASALRDAARYVRTLERIDKAGVQRLKLAPGGHYVRVRVTKSNYEQPEGSHIIEIGSHTLMNGPLIGGKPSAGDKVGIIKLYPQLEPAADVDDDSNAADRSPAAPARQSPTVRTAPLTDDEINIIVGIAAGGRYKSGPKDWIGPPIAAALGLDPSVNRGWINAQIKKLLASKHLIQWKDTSGGKSGRQPEFLKPAGYAGS